MEQEKDFGYYAVIPVLVLQDKRLKSNAKLLYGQVSSLSNKYGYCYASDSTLGSFIGVAENSVSGLLKQLEKYHYITRDVEFTKNGKSRKIYIATPLNGGEPTPQMQEANPSNEGIILKVNNKDDNKPSPVDIIYEYFKEKINPSVRLTDKSIDFIKKRLKKYSVAELRVAIEKFAADDWRMKNNAEFPIAWYFRTDDQVEKWLALNSNKKKAIDEEDFV